MTVVAKLKFTPSNACSAMKGLCLMVVYGVRCMLGRSLLFETDWPVELPIVSDAGEVQNIC